MKIKGDKVWSGTANFIMETATKIRHCKLKAKGVFREGKSGYWGYTGQHESVHPMSWL
jgi:hypothetical protein